MLYIYLNPSEVVLNVIEVPNGKEGRHALTVGPRIAGQEDDGSHSVTVWKLSY